MTTPVTDAILNRQLRRAHDYCTKHTLLSLVQWFPEITIGNVPIDKAKGLHLGSYEGKLLRQLCMHVETRVLKDLIRKLAQVDTMRKQSPAAQACFANWCTIHVVGAATATTTTPPAVIVTKPGLQDLPDALRQRLHALVLGWWVRFTIEHKGLGYYLRSGWSNDVDPVTLDDVRTELPSVFTMTTYEFEVKKRKCWIRRRTGPLKGEWTSEFKAVGPKPTKTPKVFVFDVRTLDALFRKKQRKSPFDNREFDKTTIEHVTRRIRHLTQRGYLQPTKSAQPLHTATASMNNVTMPVRATRPAPKVRAVNLCSEMDRLNFPVCVEWLTDLRRTQIIRWYQRCEDIWTYRAQLSSAQQAQIAPGGRRVFYARNRIRNVASLNEMQHLMLDAMERLVTTGHTEADRTNGVMYVLMALTEVSRPIRETYSYLYQPDETSQNNHNANANNATQANNANNATQAARTAFVQAIVTEMSTTNSTTVTAALEPLARLAVFHPLVSRPVPTVVMQHIAELAADDELPTNTVVWAMEHYANETFGTDIAQAVRATLAGNGQGAAAAPTTGATAPSAGAAGTGPSGAGGTQSDPIVV